MYDGGFLDVVTMEETCSLLLLPFLWLLRMVRVGLVLHSWDGGFWFWIYA